MVTLNFNGSVGIVGAGWLGLALAKQLQKEGGTVVVTTQTPEKINTLQAQSLHAELLSLPLPTNIETNNNNAVFEQQNLVICIPPQLKKNKRDYPEKISQIVRLAEKGGCQKVILLNTTAIYNGLTGEVNEDNHLDFSAEKVEILEQAEQAALKFSGKVCILRLAGLVGPDRHPGRFLARQKQLSSANSAVNLIHQQDAIGLILSLLNTASSTGVFNGVSQTHVSRKQFYQAAAKAVNLSQPSFNTDISKGKTVKGDKAQKQLAYQFIYDDLLAWMAC